jgi:hypothetical protein
MAVKNIRLLGEMGNGEMGNGELEIGNWEEMHQNN